MIIWWSLWNKYFSGRSFWSHRGEYQNSTRKMKKCFLCLEVLLQRRHKIVCLGGIGAQRDKKNKKKKNKETQSVFSGPRQSALMQGRHRHSFVTRNTHTGTHGKVSFLCVLDAWRVVIKCIKCMKRLRCLGVWRVCIKCMTCLIHVFYVYRVFVSSVSSVSSVCRVFIKCMKCLDVWRVVIKCIKCLDVRRVYIKCIKCLIHVS